MNWWGRGLGFVVAAAILGALVIDASRQDPPVVDGSGPVRSTTTTSTAPPAPSAEFAPAGPAIHLAPTAPGSVADLVFGAEDLVAVDPRSGSWELRVDGSELGLDDADGIDGFHLRDDGGILLSVAGSADLDGIGPVDDGDVIEFIPTGLGPQTAGSLSLYFDGSANGLSRDVGIDAVGLDPDGNLLVSLDDRSPVTGGGGDRFLADPQDVLRFDGSALSTFLDGSAVDLVDPGEDVTAISVDRSGILHLVTAAQHEVVGAAGGPGDVLQCVPTSVAPIAGCDWTHHWRGDAGPMAGLTITGSVNYFTDFSRPLGSEWVLYDSEGHAGWGLRRPSAVEVVENDDASGGGLLTITAQMGRDDEVGLLVSGGLKLKRPQTYGRYIMRLRADPDPDQVTSMVALLWPESNQWPRDGEIDIVETFGSRATRTPVESALHWLNAEATVPYERSDDAKTLADHPGVDGTRWHTYVLEWRADRLSVAIDGGPPVVLSTDPAEIAAWNMEPTFQLDAFDAPSAPGEQPVISAPVVMSVDYLLIQP